MNAAERGKNSARPRDLSENAVRRSALGFASKVFADLGTASGSKMPRTVWVSDESLHTYTKPEKIPFKVQVKSSQTTWELR